MTEEKGGDLFARVEVIEDSEWGQAFEIHCGTESTKTIVPMGEDAERKDADDYAHDLNRSHEADVAKRVKEAVEEHTRKLQVAWDVRLRMEIQMAVERCAKIISTNWCDALLTGKDKALSGEAGKWGCPDIENLLRGIIKEIKAQGVTHG